MSGLRKGGHRVPVALPVQRVKRHHAFIQAVVFFSLVLIGMGVMTGCGTVGAPIPPEDLPVAQKLLKEKEREAREKSKAIQEQKEEQTKGEEKPEGQAIAPEEVPLPPLRPVGTR